LSKAYLTTGFNVGVGVVVVVVVVVGVTVCVGVVGVGVISSLFLHRQAYASPSATYRVHRCA